MISKAYDRYPKSVSSSGSSTGARKARKLSIFHTEPEAGREYREEQEQKEEREERYETIKGKEAPADIGKKFQRSRLIFRKEGTIGFIEAGYID